MKLDELPFDVLMLIARQHWKAWYKLSLTLKDFGQYSIRPKTKLAAQKHFNFVEESSVWQPTSKAMKLVNGSKVLIQRTKIDGVQHGTEKHFNNLNQLMLSCSYYEGMLDGLMTRFFPNGLPDFEIMYRNDKKNGKSVHYYSNGKIMTVQFYIDDVRNGIMTTYYNEKGTKRTETMYNNNKISGTEINYYENGNIYSIGYYVDGEKSDVSIFYDEHGKLLIDD